MISGRGFKGQKMTKTEERLRTGVWWMVSSEPESWGLPLSAPASSAGAGWGQALRLSLFIVEVVT